MTPQLILIGPPGAGKSSVGQSIGQRLSVPFADTDALIEEEVGKKISEIFLEEGEPYFREVEERVCCAAIANSPGILSLGGGSVLSVVTQNALKSSGIPIVFLDVSLTVAAPRVGFNRDRPLLVNNPRQQWQILMDKRRPIYESLASVRIDVDEKSVSKIVDEILSEAPLS